MIVLMASVIDVLTVFNSSIIGLGIIVGMIIFIPRILPSFMELRFMGVHSLRKRSKETEKIIKHYARLFNVMTDDEILLFDKMINELVHNNET